MPQGTRKPTLERWWVFSFPSLVPAGRHGKPVHFPHIAEHSRGMVAATVARVSINTSASIQADVACWQHWALGVADEFAGDLPTMA